MEIIKKLRIKNPNGLHTRVVAILVSQASMLIEKYKISLFLRRAGTGNEIPANSMLALVNLRLKKGELIEIIGKGENAKLAVEQLVDFLNGIPENKLENREEVDNLLENSSIISDKILDSMVNGVIAVDEKSRINIFNRAAEKITGLEADEVIGKNILDLIQEDKLDEVIKKGKDQIGIKEKLGNSIVITNRSPIFSQGKILGAVATFQDISELESLSCQLKTIQELQERLQYILEASHDAISMVDSNYLITYVNSAYEKMRGVSRKEIIGKNILFVYPESYIVKVLKEKKPYLDVLTEKENGIKILSNISPIIVEGELKGAVSISKEVTEIQRLADSLQRAQAKAKYLEDELIRKQKLDKSFAIIVGNSGPLKEALFVASKASETLATVLIRGESGTGKELVAKAIHYAGGKKNQPFIRVNCAAIPTNLLESEFFGYEAGAFTGAVKTKPGKFELAHNGTIFLDEIGDMTLEMQAKLLRVIQEKEFERVGGIKTIHVSVRIIAATNRNLEEMLKKGQFREDLYYRLNIIPVYLPSLKERKSDIPLLAEYFLKKVTKNINKKIDYITHEALNCLSNYNWPGNIRELENVIERGCILTERNFLDSPDLPSYINQREKEDKKSLINIELGLTTMEEYEKSIIALALEKYKTFNQAGKVLGLTHKTVAAKARKYGLTIS